jgi:hypothetical protein
VQYRIVQSIILTTHTHTHTGVMNASGATAKADITCAISSLFGGELLGGSAYMAPEKARCVQCGVCRVGIV